MSRRLFHSFCVILLLIAQEGAIVHATWHAGNARAHENDTLDLASKQEAPGGPADLCAFDLAFGQVLGGVHGASAQPVITELPALMAAYSFNPRLGSDAVTAQSRGPPIFL